VAPFSSYRAVVVKLLFWNRRGRRVNALILDNSLVSSTQQTSTSTSTSSSGPSTSTSTST